MIQIITVIKIISSIISCYYFFKSATSRFPVAPKKGELISADYFQKLAKILKSSSNYSSKGCAFLAITILIDIIVLTYDVIK